MEKVEKLSTLKEKVFSKLNILNKSFYPLCKANIMKKH